MNNCLLADLLKSEVKFKEKGALTEVSVRSSLSPPWSPESESRIFHPFFLLLQLQWKWEFQVQSSLIRRTESHISLTLVH